MPLLVSVLWVGTLVSHLESRSIMKVFSCVDGSLYQFFCEQTQARITCFSVLLMFHHRVSYFEDQKKLTLKTYCICALSHFSWVHLFVNTWTEPARPLCLWEFSRQEYWNGWPCCTPGDLPSSGVKPMFPALQADPLPFKPSGKPKDLLVPFKR